MKYRAIRDNADRYPIRLMTHVLHVPPAGHYAWLDRPESPRSVTNRGLLGEIRLIHGESRETDGSPSIWDALVKHGHRIGENRVARLMRNDGIRAKTVKEWKATTDSGHKLPVAANTLNRQFTVNEPGLGRRHHLRLDVGRLARSRRRARSLLPPSGRLFVLLSGALINCNNTGCFP